MTVISSNELQVFFFPPTPFFVSSLCELTLIFPAGMQKRAHQNWQWDSARFFVAGKGRVTLVGEQATESLKERQEHHTRSKFVKLNNMYLEEFSQVVSQCTYTDTEVGQ